MRQLVHKLSYTLVYFFLTKPVFAAPQDWATQPNRRCVLEGDVATIQGFECLFFNILQVVTAIAGLVFLFMFITGGFQYLFSSNDQKKVAQASSTLTSAVIGLIGIIISYFILNFIKEFTGISVLDFVIPIGP